MVDFSRSQTYINALYAKSKSQQTIWNIFLIFPRKQALTVHAISGKNKNKRAMMALYRSPDIHSQNRNYFKTEFILLITIFLSYDWLHWSFMTRQPLWVIFSYDGNTKKTQMVLCCSWAFLHPFVFIGVNHSFKRNFSSVIPASILRKSTSGRHRPVSYPDGPMTARYRFT